MQNWKKAGLIYSCNHAGALPYYAAVPFAKSIGENIFRVYYSARNRNNQSYVSYFDFDIHEKKTIADEHRILLEAGNAGAFDDAGSVLFQVLPVGDEEWLYYSGWSLEVAVPFRFNIGLAKSTKDNSEFIRFSEGPVAGQTIFDPYMAGAPYVIQSGGKWKMWYISCLRWSEENGKPKHHYLVKYTESSDGIHWFGERKTAIHFKDQNEFAIARPVVIFEDGIYKMWYSYRGEYYKIGYAESPDGVQWQRKDELVNLPVSPGGWDSEMICYGFVFDHKEHRYMLYNGNGYGKSGIGLAVLEK